MATEPRRKRPDSAVKLGAALRSLRKRAGLKQTDVARLMGKTGKGGDTTVSRLERGYFEQPRRDTIARYVEGCGGGPEDVAMVLEAPTTPTGTADLEPQPASSPLPAENEEAAKAESPQPAVGSPQVQSAQEEKTPAKARKEKTREQKLAAIERKARRLLGRAMLEEMLYDMLKSGLPPEAMAEQKALAEHGRKTFELLARMRQSRQHLRKKTLETRGVTPEQAEQVEEIIGRVFKVLEDAGDLERKPAFDPEQVLAGKQKLVPPRKAEDRIMDELRQEVEAWSLVRNKVIQQIRTECVNRMTEQGIPTQEAGRLSQHIPMFCALAEKNPDSQERLARVRELSSRARTEETRTRLERLAEHAFRRWDELKGAIPPRPRALRASSP